MEIRKATEADDEILVRHYLALWDSYGTPREQIFPDAKARVLDFIHEARKHRGLGAFLAIVDGGAVGSVACQLHISPYPQVVMPKHRRYGYIWSVFVEPDHRGRGVARALMEKALDHLRSAGCTKAVLHSSDAGERLYEQLGFELAKEMRFAL